MQSQRLTVREAARIMNVSERQVYLAKELLRTGQDDLADRVMAGELTTLGALKIAQPEKYAPKPEGAAAGTPWSRRGTPSPRIRAPRSSWKS